MTDSKPTTIGELPLANDDFSQYNKYTVIGKDNGQFATTTPLSTLSNDITIPVGFADQLGYNVFLNFYPSSQTSYDLGDTTSTIICKTFNPTDIVVKTKITDPTFGKVIQIKTFNINGTKTITFDNSVFLIDGDTTEYTSTTISQNQNLKMFGLYRVKSGATYSQYFIKLRRAI